MLDYIRDPAEIYRRSFATIEKEAKLDGLPPAMRPIAIRLIHACGMPDIVADLKFSADAAEKGRAALGAGAPIFTDVDSVRTGIIGRLLPANNAVTCRIAEAGTAAAARTHATTRAAAQVDLWGDAIEGAIVAIGNAPTTLFRLLERIDQGGARPALILGFPVGFVGAAESKAELAADPRGLPFVTLLGRRGGSAMASAAVNAIAAGLAA
jgi:precorrin-8X/cobalt-precorrin-8 methylmutase